MTEEINTDKNMWYCPYCNIILEEFAVGFIKKHLWRKHKLNTNILSNRELRLYGLLDKTKSGLYFTKGVKHE